MTRESYSKMDPNVELCSLRHALDRALEREAAGKKRIAELEARVDRLRHAIEYVRELEGEMYETSTDTRMVRLTGAALGTSLAINPRCVCAVTEHLRRGDGAWEPIDGESEVHLFAQKSIAVRGSVDEVCIKLFGATQAENLQ